MIDWKSIGLASVLGALVLLVLLLLLGSLSCVTASGATGVRREASARLATCLGLGRYKPVWVDRERCRRESQEFCRSQGLEERCGVDGVWGR